MVFNFLGNEILSHTMTLLFYILYGYSNPTTFLIGAGMSVAGLILHIKDITGKSINSIIDKLKFSEENIRNNIFMRITLILIIVFLILAIIFPILSRYLL